MDFNNFEKEISKINKNIFGTLRKKSEEEVKTVKKTVEFLNTSNNNDKEIIAIIEGKIKNIETEATSNMQSIRSNVNKKYRLLLNNVKKYEDQTEENALKVALSNQRIEAMKSFQAAEKRKRTDLNTRIGNVEKDYASKLKDLETLFTEKEKDYKTRNAELLRKQDFDIRKARAETVKSTDEAEKLLLNTDDKRKISDIKKQITQTKINEIIQVAELKKKYAETIMKSDVDYNSFKENHIVNVTTIDGEGKCKLLDLDLLQTKVTIEDRENVDNYDFEDQLKIIELRNKLRGKYYLEDKKIIDAIKTDEKNCFVKCETSEKGIYENKLQLQLHAFTTDTSRVDALRKLFIQTKESCTSNIGVLTNWVAEILNSYKNFCLDLFDQIISQRKSHMSMLYRTLIVIGNKNNGDNKANAETMHKELSKAIDDLFKSQEKKLDQLVKNVDSLMENVVTQIRKSVSYYEDYQKDEEYAVLELLKFADDKLRGIKENDSYFLTNELATSYKELDTLTKDYELTASIKNNEIEDNHLLMIKKYEDDKKEHNDNIEKYNKKTQESIENANLSLAKEKEKISLEISQAVALCKDNINRYEKERMISFKNEIKEIELEKKELLKKV